MDAQTVVKLAFIVLELTCAGIITAFMCRALDMHPFRAMLKGVEILAFMVVACFPAPRKPGRHVVRRTVTV